MKPIEVRELKSGELEELQAAYDKTKDVRIRTRTQMILLAVEQSLTAPQIGQIVRKNEQTVRGWIKRFNAEGLNGLSDAPRPGSPTLVTPEYRQRLLNIVRKSRGPDADADRYRSGSTGGLNQSGSKQTARILVAAAVRFFAVPGYAAGWHR